MTTHPYIRKLRRLVEEKRASRREFLWTSTILGLSASSAYQSLGLVAPVQDLNAQEAGLSGGVLRIGLPVDNISDPHMFSSRNASLIQSQALETLSFVGPDNIVRPRLLESWEASDDLMSWELRIRSGIKWRKGRPLTIDDVIWNLRRVLGPESNSWAKGLVAGYLTTVTEGTFDLWNAGAIERLDEKTMRINLRVPALSVPEAFAQNVFAILDPEEGGVFAIQEGESPNGTGPFELYDYEEGWRALFRRNDLYWGGTVALDGVEFLHLPREPDAGAISMKAGVLNLLARPSLSLLELLQQSSLSDQFQFPVIPTSETAVARMRLDLDSPFNDRNVRYALKLAIDPGEAVKFGLGGFGDIAEHHHVSPIHPDYAELGIIESSVSGARALLADAGFPEGLELEIVAPNEPDWIPQYLDNLIEQWSRAGVIVTPRLVDEGEYWLHWKDYAFALTPWIHRANGAMVMHEAYRSDSPWNESQFSVPEFDHLAEQALAILDPEERRDWLYGMESIIQNDGPIVQPVFYSKATVVSSTVVNLSTSPDEVIDLRSVSFARPTMKPTVYHVRQSTVTFIERPDQESAGFGLYSYLLMVNESESNRNARILELVLSEFSHVDDTRYTADVINLICVPLREPSIDPVLQLLRGRDSDRGRKLAGYFNYALCRDVLGRLCSVQNYRQFGCDPGNLGGPFVLCAPRPVTQKLLDSRVEPPMLLIDLSDMPEAGFGEVVNAFRVHVMGSDPFSENPIKGVKFSVLRVVLRGGQWFELAVEGFEGLKYLWGGDAEARQP